MSYAGLKKPDTKGHKLYDPIIWNDRVETERGQWLPGAEMGRGMRSDW